MKKIGLIGGLSYQSTLHYYQGINDGVNARLGGLTSAEILLHSVNFADYKRWMDANDWERITWELKGIATEMRSAGADCIAIASNTMHKVANQIEDGFEIPFIHIGDAVAKKCVEAGVKKVGLIGTRFTMTEKFIWEKVAMHDIDVLTPEAPSVISEIDRIIFDELCKGTIRVESERYLTNEINRMIEKGAEGVILGFTESQMMFVPGGKHFYFKPGEYYISEAPLFDTTQAHIDALVDFCVSDEQEVEYGPARNQGFV